MVPNPFVTIAAFELTGTNAVMIRCPSDGDQIKRPALVNEWLEK